MPRNNVNSILLKHLGTRPIAFNPVLGKIIGSANGGLFMSQLLYWWGKGRKKHCIYKTISEMQEETCLTRSEQDTAIKKWKRLGVLDVQAKGVPPKRHFYINVDKFVEILEKFTKQDMRNFSNNSVGNRKIYASFDSQNVENGKTNYQNMHNTTEINIRDYNKDY